MNTITLHTSFFFDGVDRWGQPTTKDASPLPMVIGAYTEVERKAAENLAAVSYEVQPHNQWHADPLGYWRAKEVWLSDQERRIQEIIESHPIQRLISLLVRHCVASESWAIAQILAWGGNAGGYRPYEWSGTVSAEFSAAA